MRTQSGNWQGLGQFSDTGEVVSENTQVSKLKKLMTQTGSPSQRRFLTPADMAIIKHDASVSAASKKRQGAAKANGKIVLCGCGVVGCAVHFDHENR